MKNSSFENNLKSLSQDFVVDINQQQFSRVMELRAKQHKREMLLWWFVSVTATILFSLFLTLTTKLNQTATNNTHLSVHKNNKVIEIVKESNLSNTTSTQIKINTPKHDLKTSLSNDLKSSANLKHQKNSALNPNILTHQTTKNIKLNVIEPHQTINEEVTYTFINKPELIKHQDYSIAIATIKNVVLPLNNNLTEIEKHKIGSKLIKGIYFKAAYFPFLSAKNTSSMLPNKKASLVGLGEDANFAQSLSAGIVINLTPNLEITGGIGIQTIRFDKIRTIDINVDTMPESLVTQSLTTGFEHVADFSFTRIDVPIALRYIKPIKNKLNWYVQAGVNYSYLIQHKSYVFIVDSNVLESYSLKTNYASNRINKNQIAITLEPGFIYSLNRNVTLNLGVPFQQELFSVYNKEYADRPAFNLLGLKAGVQFNF